MNHIENCQCVICAEWGGRVPHMELNEPLELQSEDLPDPFDGVLGG